MSFLSPDVLVRPPAEERLEIRDPTRNLAEYKRNNRMYSFHDAVKLRREASIAKKRPGFTDFAARYDQVLAITRLFNGCLSEYAKSNKISHSNLINKASRQTIEAFLEKGVWKIGEEQK